MFAQHLGMDTARLDDRGDPINGTSFVDALRLFQDIARCNRVKMESREPGWQGLAFALSPEAYARKSGVTLELT